MDKASPYHGTVPSDTPRDADADSDPVSRFFTADEPATGEQASVTEAETQVAAEPAPQSAAEFASGRKLLNATALMASGTLLSRILGFVRLAMLAFLFGNLTNQADAFTVSQYIPSSLYIIFAGGALNTVLVPQIVRAIVHHADKGEAFLDRVMTVFLLALGGLTIVMTIGTPLLLTVFTDARWRSPELAAQYGQLTLMTFLTMPQLFFYGVFFLIGQVLNAREKFAPLQWAPVLNNVVTIVVLGIYIGVWGMHGDTSAAFTTEQAWLLGLGSTLGIVVQTAALVPYLHRVGYRYKPRFDLRGTGLRRMFKLSSWALGAVLCTQLASIVVNNLASSATAGAAKAGAGVNAYGSAMLVWTLPHSLITVSLATAMLTSLSQHAARNDKAAVARETMQSLRISATAQVPAMLLFLVLATPIAMLMFGHGQGAKDSAAVGTTLWWFALGTVPYMITFLAFRGFYAQEDNRTPFLLQLAISVLNAVLAIVLIKMWDDPATVAPRLALAYTISYLVGAVLSYLTLKRSLPDLDGKGLLQQLAKLVLASLPAAVVALFVMWLASPWPQSQLVQGIALVAALPAAAIAFFLTARRLDISETAQILAAVRRRGARPGGAADVPGEELAPEEEAEQTASTPETAAVVETGTATVPQAAEAAAAMTAVQGTAVPLADTTPAVSEAVAVAAAAVATVQPGQSIGRYRLDTLLTTRDTTQTWLAHDTTLSRPVLIHVLAPDDPRQQEIVELARRAAVATDSRFLRVLDVETTGTTEHGAFLVYEYVEGRSLSQVLATGELSSREAAWITREVADALWPLHHRGLFHRELNPDTVIVAANGNVKIVGFMVESALYPRPGEEDGKTRDVLALGRLLYAMLVARWPGGPDFGLRAAPVDAQGRPLTPAQVKAGVPRPLDSVCDRILSPQPRGRIPRLTSAHEIVTTLNQVLGGINAARDLEVRMQRDGAVPASASSTPSATDVTTVVPPADEEIPFTPVPPPATTGRTPTHPDPVSRPALLGGDLRPDGPRWGVRALLIVLAAVLVVSLGIVAANQLRGGPGPTTPGSTPTPTRTASPLSIVGVQAFDPKADGGDAAENSAKAAQAVDANPETAWTTERYRSKPNLGGLKPGVGLVLDLGEAKDVTAVTLNLGGDGSTVEIRVPVEEATDGPPMDSQSQWRKVGSVEGAPDGTSTVTFDPVKTRYVLVYFTSLPPSGTIFVGTLREVSVLG